LDVQSGTIKIGNNTLSSSGVSTFSSGIVVSAGTTSSPSISPSGDSNTGIFFPSADTIAFGEGGAESARFDSSGRLGIGTANPSYLLHTSGSGGTIGHQLTSNSNTIRYTNSNTTAEWTAGTSSPGLANAGNYYSITQLGTDSTWRERLVIDSSGRVKMPYQPAFLASGNQGTITVAVGSYFPFNTLNTTFANSNRNSGYNTSTYLYTAPVAGLYQFYVQLYLNPNSVISSLTWWKNGTQLDYGSDAAINIFMNTNSSTTPANIMLNGSVILELSANDTVGIKPRTGNPSSISFYTGHSTFWGYLIG
jgi:hypothetical protein